MKTPESQDDVVARVLPVRDQIDAERVGVGGDASCGCDPRDRYFHYTDWNSRPARFAWSCLNCGGVGMLFIDHSHEGYVAESKPLADVIWENVDHDVSRRSRRVDGIHSVYISGDFLRQVVRHEVQRQTADLFDQVRAMRSQAKSVKSKYRRLLDGLLRRVSAGAPVAPPTTAMPILCDGHEERIAIYALVDPNEPERVRYVGQSKAPGNRYLAHLTGHPWALELVEAGRRPLMLLVEWCETTEMADGREMHWIGHYLSLGMADQNKALPRKIV